jgi:hypothetical protein
MMKKHLWILIAIELLAGCRQNESTTQAVIETVCNPMDLSYRFCLDEPSRREAADPSVIVFKDKYYLFASKSGGYWHSDDLKTWTFIETNEIPTEEYAPTAVVIGDIMYFLASSTEKSTIYKSTDPLSGKWDVALDSLQIPVWDPAFFLDDDQRLYLYWGCSNVNPIYGVELDYENNFAFIGESKELLHANPAEHGWEVPGDYNTRKDTAPWIEGAWMNKHNGRYYLQYSGPGTEFKSYSDAVYIADKPLGPYELAPHNPFAYRPEGFAAAAGHGSTFQDKHGNYWHIGTATISVKHMFERRLVLYPTFFDEQGVLYAGTQYGDYPRIIPDKKINGFDDIFPGWMLLSYKKQVEVSSSIDSLPASNITDEDIRTYWAAQSGNAEEYAIVDLDKPYDVCSVQINFAEQGTDIYGRQKELRHRYIVEYSNDKSNWEVLIDKSQNETDNSHDYTQLPEKVNCRYLKLKNIEVPGGHFALSGFRVFGKGDGKVPNPPANLMVERSAEDQRNVKLTWDKSADADGFSISFGADENKLYNNYTVYDDTEVNINSLNALQTYYFSIEAFNENGISQKTSLIKAE